MVSRDGARCKQPRPPPVCHVSVPRTTEVSLTEDLSHERGPCAGNEGSVFLPPAICGSRYARSLRPGRSRTHGKASPAFRGPDPTGLRAGPAPDRDAELHAPSWRDATFRAGCSGGRGAPRQIHLTRPKDGHLGALATPGRATGVAARRITPWPSATVRCRASQFRMHSSAPNRTLSVVTTPPVGAGWPHNNPPATFEGRMTSLRIWNISSGGLKS